MTTFLIDFVQSLSQYSDLTIATLTIAIVYFAARTLQSHNKTLRLSILPHLLPKVEVLGEKTFLTIENHSDHPAYDVDIVTLGQFNQQEVPYKSQLDTKYAKWVKIDFSRTVYDYESEHYCVRDHLGHYVFPPNRKLRVELDFSVQPSTLSLVIQFRDSLGQNYLYQGWLFHDILIEKSHLTLGSFKTSFGPTQRVNIFDAEETFNDLIELYENTDHIPMPMRLLRLVPMYAEDLIAKLMVKFYLEKGVRDDLLRCLPAGYQKRSNFRGTEGRGDFSGL